MTSVYLMRGDDPTLIAQASSELIRRLAGECDPSGVVEELGLPLGDAIDVGAVIDALRTPPFITPMRIVVVREIGRLGASDAARLAECLKDPVEGVFLVMAGGGGAIPAVLTKTIQHRGEVIDTSVGTGRNRMQWLTERLRESSLKFDAKSASVIASHFGEDMGRLAGLVDMLQAAYGSGASVEASMVLPFLGEAGSVPPWDLTDAVDGGDSASALGALSRMTGQGGYHPLAIMGLLHRHYQSMLRLDGATVTSPEQAAELLGMRSAFRAKKSLEQGRQLGSARIGRAITLLADADLDLKGRTALEPQAVIEVLVGRLSRLGPARRR